MIHIQTLVIGPIATNCYVVHNDDDGTAIIIDPGYESDPIIAATEGMSVSHILLTHAHCDHIGGAERLKEATGAKLLIHHAEADWLLDPQLNLSFDSAYAPWPVHGPSPDVLLDHGDVLTLLGEKFEVRHTPGHSPGHVSYVLGDVVFGGDALFYGSIGRTDLPGGDHETLIRSIRERLFTLPPTTTVLPGHGPPTTIGDEMQTNPYVSW